MTVTPDTRCPYGTEQVFQRPWYGIEAACDCLGIGIFYDDGTIDPNAYSMNIGETCVQSGDA